jgi:Tfp pilus assembly PilM family ATPase
MPHLLAIEWDDAEARLAVAEVRRDSVVLEQAFSITLESSRLKGGAESAGPVSMSGAHDLGAIGNQINEALTARGIRRGKTLVAVGRANIELKNLTLPPAPDDELPELVRFQAEREFNALSDEWPLDFIPLPSEPEEQLTVLAAAISPELIAEIQITCQGANLSPQRLILRPCAAASLLCRARPAEEKKLRLLVDLLAEEADLTVLAGDAVVFMRTARLPVESFQHDPLRILLPEIRRTIAAVHNRFTGRHVEEIFLCGEPAQQGALARDIGRELDIPAEVFNPLSCCTLGPELRRSMPDQPGRFAPLVGMLLDEASPGIGTIDFLNPRRKPEAPNRRREYTIAAAAALLLLLLGGGWMWYALGSLDDKIDELTEQVNGQSKQVKEAKELVDKAGEIDKWLGGEISWLDQLAFLADKAPKAEDLMLTRLSTPVDFLKHSSIIHLEGVAIKPDIGAKLLNDLTDPQHVPTQKNASNEPPRRGNAVANRYPWVIKADVGLKTAAPEKPGAKKAAAGAAKSAGAAPKDSKPTVETSVEVSPQ